MQNLWIPFMLGTVICWGTYGPALHAGQVGFADEVRANNALRALLCVGGAYFLVGVLVPVVLLQVNGQLGGFTARGTLLSGLAGVLGALGAVGIIWAFKNGGKPFIVMPLVFAGAPIVNAITSIVTHPPEGGLKTIDWRLYLGFILAATGAYMVLAYKPS